MVTSGLATIHSERANGASRVTNQLVNWETAVASRLSRTRVDQRDQEDDQVRLNQEPPGVCLNLASLSHFVNDAVVDAYDKQPQARQHGWSDHIDDQFGD